MGFDIFLTGAVLFEGSPLQGSLRGFRYWRVSARGFGFWVDGFAPEPETESLGFEC